MTEQYVIGYPEGSEAANARLHTELSDFAKEIKEVNCRLFKSYYHRSVSVKNLCKTAIERVDDFTVDKHSRWLGFVQGILYSEGLLDLDETREFTRTLFQEVYVRHGISQEMLSATVDD